MNAAGTCKSLTGDGALPELARSVTAACMMGSVTIEQRLGNGGSVYQPGGIFSLNSLGMPNPGSQWYREKLPEAVRIAHDAGKPLFVSVAGFSPEEYADLTEMALEGGADLVEQNLGCPNIWDGGEQKVIASFSPDLIAEILSLLHDRCGSGAPICVKLSPFSNPVDLERAAAAIAASNVVKVVATSNTFPNALSFLGDGSPSISVGSGLAGLGGPAMKPIGLGQVCQLRAKLPGSIQIIGIGGIRTGSDVADYLRAGADAVAIASLLVDDGNRVFERLLSEGLELF